jgi:threonine dehydrogenase-like Zn-dependent dehydrogenase
MAYSTSGVKSEAQISMDMLCDGLIDNASLITHTCSPEDHRRAFDLAVNKGASRAFKVMFVRD